MHDINTFREGSIVDIVGIPTMHGILIERISESGVTISGGEIPDHTVISGRSPAVYHTAAKKELAAQIKKPTEALEPINGDKPAGRQSHAAKMSRIQVPPGKFTIKQLAELNDIPQPYAFKWAKDNCAECGFAPKPAGQRGRAAVLYMMT